MDAITIRAPRPMLLLLLLGLLLLPGLLGCAGGGPAPTPQPAPRPPSAAADRDAVTLRMVQLARAGRIDEARAALRGYAAAHPGDGIMLYNLACLDLLAADHETAFAHLETALAAGYSNFRHMEADRSLAPLRDDPRYQPLVDRYEQALRDTFQARALVLEAGYPVAGIPLHAADGAGADAVSLRARLTLSYDHEGLTLAVDAVDPAFAAAAPPWEGGAGLLVNLVRPIGHDDYESRRFHSVGVGLDDGRPAAWLVSHDGDVRLEPLPGVAPVLERRDDRVRWRVLIPWRVFHPYGPPLDVQMGLNVFCLGAGAGPSRPVLALMPESRLSYEPAPWRRYVPVDFLDSDRSRPALRGRLYDRLVERDAVELEAAAWCGEAGAASWELEVVDADGAAVPGVPVEIRAWTCEAGLNFFDAALPVPDLPTGDYRLRARCTLPGGRTFALDEAFSRFQGGWLEDLNRRLHVLDSPRAELVRYHLFVLARDLERRHPQDPADVLHHEYLRVRGLVEACESGAPILPDAGPFLGGFAVDTMVQRSCALHLPAGWRGRDDLHLLLVVPPAPGREQELAAALGARLDDAVVLVPQSHGSTGLALDKAARHTVLAADWARGFFGPLPLTLAGLGAGADAALAAAQQRPELFTGLLLDADHLFLEDDRFSAAHLSDLLADAAAAPPTTLAARLVVPERLEIVAAALRARGTEVTVLRLPASAGPELWLADLAAGAGPRP